jgi:hypothetical protein
MHVIRNCPSCGTETRCARREFSEQAWAVLVVWGEIEESVVDHPLCQSCYEELRDILIDRAAEVEPSLKNPKQYAAQVSKSAPAKQVVQKKEAPAPKVAAAAPKKVATAAKKPEKADKAKKTKKVSRMAS